MFRPKLLTTLKLYTKDDFRRDLIAGVNVGIVAIPLSMAFGVLSGLSPQEGLLTAIVAGFLTALLGGSRVQISGPTGASAVVIYGIVQQYGRNGLAACTILAGVFLIFLGLAKLGHLIKFVPRPLSIGFTSAIAAIIFSAQIRDLFGLQIEQLPFGFLEKWECYWHSSSTWNPNALWISLVAIAIMLIWPRFSDGLVKRLPAPVVVLIVSSLLVFIFKLPVETIGSRYGSLKLAPKMMDFSLFSIPFLQDMIRPALAVALLGAMVSLLSAVVGDGMIQGHHRSNTELIAQGIANMASGMVGGMPSQGAVARTVTNVRNGARTPVAGLIHSITLLVMLVLLGKTARWIPLACLAGILVVVSYRMSEWRSFLSILKDSKNDAAVLLTTFFLGVAVNLTVAMEVGIVLALFLFTRRMASVTKIKPLFMDADTEEDFHRIVVPEGVEIYEVDGPLFFASALEFLETLRSFSRKAKVLIFYLRHTAVIDASGLHVLKQFHQECLKAKTHLILAGVRAQPLHILQQSGLFELLGEQNVFSKLKPAIVRSEELVQLALSQSVR